MKDLGFMKNVYSFKGNNSDMELFTSIVTGVVCYFYLRSKEVVITLRRKNLLPLKSSELGE